MSSECTVGQKDILDIEFLSLGVPSRFGTETKVRAEETERTSRFDAHAKWVEEDKREDKEEPWCKKAELVGHEHGPRKQRNGNKFSFPKRTSSYAPSSMSMPTSNSRYNLRPRDKKNFKVRSSQVRKSVVRGSRGKPPCGTCGKLHLGDCRMGTKGCYKCGREGHVQRNCPTRGYRAPSSIAALPPPPPRGNQRGETTGASRATNRLYAMGTRQEEENSPDDVTGMIRVFSLDC